MIKRPDNPALPHAGELWESIPGTGTDLLLYVMWAQRGTRLARCLFLHVASPAGLEREGAERTLTLMYAYYRRVA